MAGKGNVIVLGVNVVLLVQVYSSRYIQETGYTAWKTGTFWSL